MNSVPPCDPGERWKPIPGYETLYLASNRGRIWSSCGKGKILRPSLGGRPGYQRYRATLCNGETKWQTSVHQLVMLAFAGPCPEGQEVRHLDGNQFNNWWEPGDEAESRAAGGNLFYGTHLENGADMSEHGTAGCKRWGSEHYRAKLTEDLAPAIRAEYAAGGVTERDLAAKYGVNVSTLHRLLVRKTWQHVA